MRENGPYEPPVVFLDGDFSIPGCRCGLECEMPCWQRVGLTADGCRDRSHEPCPDLELGRDDD